MNRKNLFALVVAVAAVASVPSAHAAGPFRALHLRSKISATSAPDTRIAFTLANRNHSFRAVQVAGHVYTVQAGHSLFIKAPAGTPIIADSQIPLHRRGDLLFQVSPSLNNQSVGIN